MRSAWLRNSIRATLFVATGWTQALAQAPPPDLSGLPPIIESTGSDNPPAFPSAPVQIDTVSPPYLQKPATATGTGPAGSVLDTLDNLPPVGDPPQNLSLPEPPRLPSLPEGPVGPETVQTPRIVRFGDVRSESAARRQYPELANRRNAAPRNAPEPPADDAGSAEAGSRPFGFLSRFMPWRRQQPPPEPPLLTRRSPGEARASTIRTSSDPENVRPEASERIDQELRAKADRTARRLVGSRATEMDVQVIDEEIYIRARPMWFWQRRQLTDDLRNLPGFDPKRLHVTVY